MFKQVLQYMKGVSLGKTEYISSLNNFKDLRFAGISLLYALVVFALASLTTYYSKIVMFQKYGPELAEYFLSNFDFFPMFIVLVVFFLMCWIFSTLIIHLAGFILGARANILPTFIILGLTLPYFAIIAITPTLYYLSLLKPVLFMIPTLLPIITTLLWLRVIYKMGLVTYSLSAARSAAMIFFTIAFTFVLGIIFLLMLPFNIIGALL